MAAGANARSWLDIPAMTTAPDVADRVILGDVSTSLFGYRTYNQFTADVAEDVSIALAAALGYAFSTTTTDADPGSGTLRFNNGTIASVTQIYVDDEDENAVDVQAWLRTLDDSSSTVKGTLKVVKVGTPTTYAYFDVTAITEATGYFKLTVSHVVSSGTFSNADEIAVSFQRAGDAGTVSAAGDGTVSAPAISFAADTNTGFYRPGADQIGVAVGGAQVGLWTSTGLNATVIGASTPAAITGTRVTAKAASGNTLLELNTAGANNSNVSFQEAGVTKALVGWDATEALLRITDGSLNARLVVNPATGNVAFNTTDLEAVGTNFKSITLGDRGYILYGSGANNSTIYAHNLYFDGSWKHRTTGVGSIYFQNTAGAHVWEVVATGSIDTVASRTVALTIANSGLIDTAQRFRVSDGGATGAAPTTGKGLEIYYSTASDAAVLSSQDRDTASAKPVQFFASSHTFLTGGIVVGSPTGGHKGVGTVNATAVYDDNVLLSDYLLDHYFDGRSDLATPGFFDPKYLAINEYTAHWQKHRSLPFMPTQETFEKDRNLGRLVSGLWAETEAQAIFLNDHEQRIAELEAEIATLRGEA